MTSNPETILKFLKPVLGTTVSEVHGGFAGSLFIDFGAITESTRQTRSGKMLTRRKGEMTLFTDWNWLFKSGDKVLADGSVIQEFDAFKILPGCKLEEVKVDPETLQTIFIFSNNLTLEANTLALDEAKESYHYPELQYAWSFGPSDSQTLYVGPGEHIRVEQEKPS